MNNEEQKIEEGSEPVVPSELDTARQERDEYLNSWKRAKADLINFQKDESKRIEQMALYGQQYLVQEMLMVLDSFDLAMASLTDESAKKGLEMIRGQMEEVLKRQGVERIGVSPGDTLDVSIHEPISEQELDMNDEKQNALAGKIVAELVSGYTMHNKVIRPAKVKTWKSELE